MPQRVVLCPGQGAQFPGMGKAWYDRSAEARAAFDRADAVLGTKLGERLSKLCFEGPAERLNQTDVSQPAIYVTSIACWRGLLATWSAGGNGGSSAKEAHVVAAGGLSLGEYTALHVAGVFSFEDGLELVTLRGRAMQDAANAIKLTDGSPGSGMVALIGADEGQAAQVCDAARSGEGDVLVSANFNAPGQIVVSGSIAACARAVDVALKMGLRATPLPVAGAFHSPLMSPAADRLAAALNATAMKVPTCPVLSNVSGRPHSPDVDLHGLRARLVEQLTKAVRWDQNGRWITANFPNAEILELAPGKTLAGLMRRIDKAVKVTPHDEPPI